MPNFKVTITTKAEVFIDADDKEEAVEIAESMLESGDIDDGDFEYDFEAEEQ